MLFRSDLGSSQRGPPSFSPPPAPSFLSGRMRPGISTSFWKVPEVNEGEARNTTRGMKFWEERNLDLGRGHSPAKGRAQGMDSHLVLGTLHLEKHY